MLDHQDTLAACFSTWHASPQPAASALITTEHPSLRTFNRRVPWIGTVESQASIALTAPITARVETIAVDDQAEVEKGTLVMRLGGPQVAGLHAKVSADIEGLNAQLDLARRTTAWFKRNLKMKMVTREQVAAAQDSQIRLETQLRQAQSSLQTLEDQVSVRASMNGAFTNRHVSVGQDVIVGQALGDIIDTRHLRITASVFPPHGIALQGKEATVRLGPNQSITGLIQCVLPQNTSTGAVKVWIKGSQIAAQLRPGQMVGGDIVVEVKPDTLAVPESAIVYDSHERPYLFVSQNSTYAPLAIQVGLEQNGWVEVLSGLKQDQLVVTQGAYELFYSQFNAQFKVQD